VPTTWQKIGYASKLRHGKMTLFSGVDVACTSCWHSADEPQPTVTFSGSTPRWRAIARRSDTEPMSGYLFAPRAAATIASTADGNGPCGASFEDSLSASGSLLPGT